jgi:hypothetical protein
MTKITQNSPLTRDTYICLIFGYAYLGGWAGLHILFKEISSSSQAEQLMPECAVAHTQTDKEEAPNCPRRDTDAQTEHTQKADCSAQTEDTEPETAQPPEELE